MSRGTGQRHLGVRDARAFAAHPASPRTVVSQTNATSVISDQVARIRAAADDRARERVITIVDDDVAICVLRIELSLAERVLVEQGRPDAVTARRAAFEPALVPAMRAAVERTTGRAVATVVADTQLDPGITVLTFTFAPAAATVVSRAPDVLAREAEGKDRSCGR
jgi:uncharacterized protein YbcI